ncbi:MAG: 3-phosphoshikimate 1-carboxyvinyltransferase [Steroidobacteraceae bacterium]
MRLLIHPTNRRLSSELDIPSSKYHAHRALILASLAPGRSTIAGLTHAKHVEYTLDLLRALGTSIQTDGDLFIVEGGPYRPTRSELSVGSSGSTLYFMTGLAALANRPITLSGQRYFKHRPVQPLLDALGAIGIRVSSNDGCPPLRIESGKPTGGHVRLPGTLSQWLSGLLLVAPFATHETVIEVDGELNERPYIELTLSMMRRFGLQVETSPDWHRYVIAPDQQARPAHVELPPDIGSAAFGLAIAALHPSDLLLRGLVLNGAAHDHPEAAFLDVIHEMGLPMQYDASARGVRIRHDGVRLRPVHVDCRETPDILPILSALGSLAAGETVLENIDHIRLKESDRVAAMLQLNRMGADVRIEGSRLLIRGVDGLNGATLSSYNDHRVLMSLAVAATRASGQTLLTYPHAYRISYPEFLEAMNRIGASMECVD